MYFSNHRYLNNTVVLAYKIVRCDTVEKLEDQVNKMLDAGWQPHSSISVSNYGSYIQIMVKTGHK